MLSEVSAETDSRLNSLLVGAAGLVVGHELGHFAVADLMNVSAEFEGFSIVYPDSTFSSREKLRVASAGFQSQWILSELAFHYLEADSNKKYRKLAEGVVLAHIGITALYLTVLQNEETGDVAAIADALLVDRDTVAIALLIPALFDAWRLRGTPPKWVPLVSRNAKGLGVAWLWNW